MLKRGKKNREDGSELAYRIDIHYPPGLTRGKRDLFRAKLNLEVQAFGENIERLTQEVSG